MSDEDLLIRRIAAEMWAAELAKALRHALNGTSHWRAEARELLHRIDSGVLPPEPTK